MEDVLRETSGATGARAAWLMQRCASRTTQAAVVRSATVDGIIAPEPGADLARALDASVLELAEALASGEPDGDRPPGSARSAMAELDRRYGEVLVEILRVRAGYVYPYMSGIGSEHPERLAPSTHVCGEPLFITETENVVFARVRRAFWICAGCGFVGESEAGISLPRVVIEGAVARIEVDQALSAATAFVGVVVEPAGSLPAEVLHARPVPASSLVQGLVIPLRSALSALWLRVLAITFVYEGEFMVFRHPVKRGCLSVDSACSPGSI